MMDWLNKLLSVDAPAGTRLQAAPEVGLRGLIPWWVAALILVAAAAVIVLFYVRERARLGLVRRGVMACLRVAAIGLLLLLILRPVLVAEYLGERPRGVALLIDNTQSMTQRDQRLSPRDRLRVAIAENRVLPDASVTDAASLGNIPADTARDPERAQLVRDVLSNPRLHLLEDLQRVGPLKVSLFGRTVHSISPSTAPGADRSAGPEKDLLADFKADESRTALADAIGELLLHKDGDLPSAVVVMTDGRDNASKASLEEVAKECARVKVPLHIYGTGSSEGGFLQLKDVGVADTLFYEDTVAVPIRWRLQGFHKGTVGITLTLGGKVVAQRDVAVREGEDLREVLTFIPHKSQEGEQKLDLVASIRLKDREGYADESKRPVRLVDRKVKVLYIENAPRWEYKFLQTALLRDRRVEASFLLINGDPAVLRTGPPFLPALPARDKLFGYDLIILGDVPASYLGAQHLEWLRDFVHEGGGLVLIAGRQHAPASYVASPLAEVLPVEFLPVQFAPDSGARTQAAQPVLTDPGKRTDMLALADTPEENLHTWQTLPGFYWQYPVIKLRPGAVSLLDHPRLKMGKDPMPLLASQYYGKGQVLFLGSDETWRWRYNVGDRYFARFWGQVVYKVGLPHLLGNARRAQLALAHAEAVLGKPSSIYARLFDPDYRPLREERVPARLESLDAGPGQERSRPLTLEAVPGQPGEYRALLANDVPGRFVLQLEHPEAASLAYRVKLPPQHELEPAGLAEETLSQAARLSGGRFYREEDLHQLAANIEPKQAGFTLRQETLLWNPLALLVFLGLVTMEWVVRKFSNLS